MKTIGSEAATRHRIPFPQKASGHPSLEICRRRRCCSRRPPSPYHTPHPLVTEAARYPRSLDLPPKLLNANNRGGHCQPPRHGAGDFLTRSAHACSQARQTRRGHNGGAVGSVCARLGASLLQYVWQPGTCVASA